MSPSPEHQDPRVGKTRRALREALLQLIEEKPFDAIVVHEITERAAINRATFYKHYRDKYDLLEQTMQELLNELAAPIETLLHRPADQVVFDALVRWLDQVARHASFYRIMLGKGGNAAFAIQLLGHLESIVTQAVRQHGSLTPGVPQNAINLRFIAAGFLGVTAWWLEHQPALSTHDVAERLHGLLNAVMRSPLSR